MAVSTMAVHAQSSVNTFSPYTFYGLGDLRAQGSAAHAGMGGANVAARGLLDNANPASLSALPRKTFHFNFGIEGGFFYLGENGKKTSYNTFNLHDVVMRMPLGRKLGFGASLSPYSSAGYRIKSQARPEDIVALYPQGVTGVDYLFKGSGDISQAKFSLGWEPVKRLSLGVEMIYYFGKIERDFSTVIQSPRPSTNFLPVEMRHTTKVSRARWGAGLQYNIIEQYGATAQSYKVLTVGATYLPELALKPALEAVTGDDQQLEGQPGENFKLPETFAAGLFYRTWKLGVGIDYERQNWANSNAGIDGIGFRNTDSFRAGAEFTPSRYDVRSFFKRVTYRAGVRHSGYYMTFNGKEMNDTAVSLGFGIPLKSNRDTYLDLGLEYGSRKAAGMVKEDYFRASIGFRLSSEGWFQKRMYQ